MRIFQRINFFLILLSLLSQQFTWYTNIEDSSCRETILSSFQLFNTVKAKIQADSHESQFLNDLQKQLKLELEIIKKGNQHQEKIEEHCKTRTYLTRALGELYTNLNSHISHKLPLLKRQIDIEKKLFEASKVFPITSQNDLHNLYQKIDDTNQLISRSIEEFQSEPSASTYIYLMQWNAYKKELGEFKQEIDILEKHIHSRDAPRVYSSLHELKNKRKITLSTDLIKKDIINMYFIQESYFYFISEQYRMEYKLASI